jgi:hypothetical protein
MLTLTVQGTLSPQPQGLPQSGDGFSRQKSAPTQQPALVLVINIERFVTWQVFKVKIR